MANTLLTPTIITRKALSILHNKITFLKAISRQYDDQFARTGAKIGSTLKIREPNQFTVRTGLVMQAQDIAESSQDLVVATVKGVDWNFDSVELTLTIDDFAARYLEPAMARLAADVEFAVLSNVYKDVYNFSGTAANSPDALLDALNANAKISQGLAPLSDRHLMFDSPTMAAMANTISAFFHKASEVERAFSQGYVGMAAGMKWWESNQVPVHTNGTRTDTTPVTNTSTQLGDDTVDITGAGNAVTYLKGDVFTIADVFAVNPETKQEYPHLQQWAVAANATSTSGGDVTVTVRPVPQKTGAKQNILVKNAGSKAVVNAGAGGSGAANAVLAQHLAWHRDAFTLVTADLELPKGVEAAREVFDGISLRYVRDFDIVNSKHPARFDVLFGFKTIRPEWATRVRG